MTSLASSIEDQDMSTPHAMALVGGIIGGAAFITCCSLITMCWCIARKHRQLRMLMVNKPNRDFGETGQPTMSSVKPLAPSASIPSSSSSSSSSAAAAAALAVGTTLNPTWRLSSALQEDLERQEQLAGDLLREREARRQAGAVDEEAVRPYLTTKAVPPSYDYEEQDEQDEHDERGPAPAYSR